VSSDVLPQHGSLSQRIPAQVKERRRLESESDGPAPFHWCVHRL